MTTAREEVQAKLTEFWVPCPISQDGWDDPGGTHPPTCQCAEPDKAFGSGRQYLLRRKCPGDNFGGGTPSRDPYCNFYFPDAIDKFHCPCGGKTGYVFHDDPVALWNAVLAEGGTLRAWIDHGSGRFVAECRLGSSLNQPQLAAADSMAEALELAVLKALEDE